MKKISLSLFTLALSILGINNSYAQSTSRGLASDITQSTQVNQQNLNTVETVTQTEVQKVQVEQAEKAAYINQLQQNKPAVVAPATSEKRKSSVAVKENQK